MSTSKSSTISISIHAPARGATHNGKNVEIIYEYPHTSIISFENILKSDEYKLMAINEVKKIIRFIREGIIDDELIDFNN